MQTHLQRPEKLFAQHVRYEIPAFQRRYVWEQVEQWEPLWDDVEELAQSGVDNKPIEAHFMGAIVLQQRPSPAGTIDRRIVVDGQQRLITLQLLFDAIREVLEERGYSEPAKRFATRVANGEEFRGGEPDYAFKVWPTVVDRDDFRHAMSRANPSFTKGERIIVGDDRNGYWFATIREMDETCLCLEYDSDPGDLDYLQKDSEYIMGRSKRNPPNPRKMSHGAMKKALERPGSAAPDAGSLTTGERIIVGDDENGYWLATIRETDKPCLCLEYDSEPGDLYYLPKDSEYIMGRSNRNTPPNPHKMSHGAMKRAIERPGSAVPDAASLIVQAHEYFKGRARQWLDSIPDETGKRDRAVCALETVVCSKLEIAVIDLEGSDNPHVIFETLNARGTPLLQSDMVKNTSVPRIS